MQTLLVASRDPAFAAPCVGGVSRVRDGIPRLVVNGRAIGMLSRRHHAVLPMAAASGSNVVVSETEAPNLERALFSEIRVECARQGSEESSREQLTMAMAVACPVALALILPLDASAMASGEVLRLSAAEIDPSTAKLAISILGPLFAAFNLLFVVRIVMSWYPQIPVGKFPFSVAYAPTEPVLGPTRRLIPPVGGVDVAPVIWVALMSFLNEVLLGQQGLLVLLSQQQP